MFRGIKLNSLMILAVFFIFLSCGDNSSTENNKKSCDDIECSENQTCKIVNEKPICECKEGYESEGDNTCKKIVIECSETCEFWEECNQDSLECVLKEGFCVSNGQCLNGYSCNTETHECIENNICDPLCDEWQECINNNCETKEGFCENNTNCESYEICDSGLHKCLEACTKNGDCSPGEICNDSGICEEVFICTDEESCYNHDDSWDEVTNPVICKDGECVKKPCISNDDCSEDMVCNNGSCEIKPSCSLVEKVEIINEPFILMSNTSKKLKARALDSNNLPLNLTEEFAWTTTQNDIVSVDNLGLVTGGSVSGSSEIKAALCGKTSSGLTIQNILPVENNKLRIIVMNTQNNAISGASVKINDITEVTDSNGMSVTDNTNATNDILVKMTGYDSVSFISVSKKDLIIYLNKEKPVNKAGGFKGNFDFSMEGGDVIFGIAGASLPYSMLDFRFRDLFGMDISRNVMSVGDMEVPASIELSLSEGYVISPEYNVVAPKGNRALWGWGGRTTLSDIMPVLQAMADEGDGKSSDFVVVLSRLMFAIEGFSHSFKLNKTISVCDKVADSDDIDEDEDIEELVPDFNGECFSEINMELNQTLSLQTLIKFPHLIEINNELTKSVLVNVFTILEKKGMVLLGMGAGEDNIDGESVSNGIVEDINIPYSPQHDGIYDNDNLVVLTVFHNQNEESLELSQRSSIIKLYKNGIIDETADFSSENYLKTADDLVLSNDIISFTAIDGVSFYRVNITDVNEKHWLIYTTSETISIENKPSGFGAIKSIILQAVVTKNENNIVSYNDLLEFNDTNMNNLIRLVTKYSNYEILVSNNK